MTLNTGNLSSPNNLSLRKYKLVEIIMGAQDENYISSLEEFMNINELEKYEHQLGENNYFEKIETSFNEVEKGEVTDLEDYLKERKSSL